MLLGLSSRSSAGGDSGADLGAALDMTSKGDANVECGASLRRFALAVLADNERELAAARDELASAVGVAGMARACGVVAQFESINRIADATGVRLDEVMENAMPGLLGDLDLERMRAT